MCDPTFVAALHYRDPKAAMAWLERVFGFETTMAIEAPDGDPTTCHYELGIDGRGRIMVGGEWEELAKSPASTGGTNTQSVHVTLQAGLDEHCDRARAAGAAIDAEPSDEFYGDRIYRVTDLEGHRWTFSMHVRDVSLADAENAIGAKIEAKHW